jgi:DNA polymerase-1
VTPAPEPWLEPECLLVDGPPAWAELTAALAETGPDGRPKPLAVVVETDGAAPQPRATALGLCLTPGRAFGLTIDKGQAAASGLLFDPGLRPRAWDEMVARLGPELTGERPKLGHNAKNDWRLLAGLDLRLPPPAADPMLASYLLNADDGHGLEALGFRRLGRPFSGDLEVPPPGKKTARGGDRAGAARRAARKADLCLRLARDLRAELGREPELERLYDELELPLEELLARMEEAGVLIDREVLAEVSADLGRSMASRERRIFELAGRTFNLASPKQLSEVLFQNLGLPSGKKTAKKTGLSTDGEVLGDLAAVHPIAAEILAWREAAKLKSTYADRLPLTVNPSTGRIHTSFNQALTVTGRLSSSNPNLQNIPARTEEGRRIRAAFRAAPGRRLISADYSQVELRVMAHFSQDAALLRAFERDEDVHAQTAAEIFGLPLDRVTPDQRREAKTINFGVIYGQGPFGLAKQLGIPQADAKKFIDQYFKRFPGVLRYMDRTRRQAAQTGGVSTWFGRRRPLPALAGGGSAKREAERMAVNAPIQGTAADLMKIAMLLVDRRLARTGARAKIVLQVHDELVLEAPEAEVEAVAALAAEEMAAAGLGGFIAGSRPLSVKLKVDVAVGSAWRHA